MISRTQRQAIAANDWSLPRGGSYGLPGICEAVALPHDAPDSAAVVSAGIQGDLDPGRLATRPKCETRFALDRCSSTTVAEISALLDAQESSGQQPIAP